MFLKLSSSLGDNARMLKYCKLPVHDAVLTSIVPRYRLQGIEQSMHGLAMALT